MGVYIKGMEPCKYCKDCYFLYVNDMTDEKFCDASYGNEIVLKRGQGKPSWCPLVEVPEPHGRLIDADATKNWHKNTANNFSELTDAVVLSLMLDEMPTVIEAEE